MGLKRHLILVDRLLPQNMSADETDDSSSRAPKVYRIVECKWQSVLLKMFLRALDDLYREHCATRPHGGNPPRMRVESASTRVEEGHAPEGLWRNCYDAAWLNSLPEYRRRALKIVDEDYDFGLTQEFDDHQEGGEQRDMARGERDDNGQEYAMEEEEDLDEDGYVEI